MTLRETADALGVRVKTVRNLLGRYRARFSPPAYVPVDGHPVRVLSPDDVATLQTCLAEYRAQAAAVAAARSAVRPLSSPGS